MVCFYWCCCEALVCIFYIVVDCLFIYIWNLVLIVIGSASRTCRVIMLGLGFQVICAGGLIFVCDFDAFVVVINSSGCCGIDGIEHL